MYRRKTQSRNQTRVTLSYSKCSKGDVMVRAQEITNQPYGILLFIMEFVVKTDREVVNYNSCYYR